MQTMVISYSLTGNNDALATSVAAALGAEHARITEAKPHTMGTIMFDLIVGRTPKVAMPAVSPERYDLVLFVAPVWIGQIATPLRASFKQLGPKLGRYAFLTVSGGADGPNLKLAAELKKRLGKEPVCLLDLCKSEFLPPEPKPTRNDTMRYRLNEAEVQVLTDKAVAALHKALAG